MIRLLCGLCATVLLAPATPAADEAVELKDYRPKVGDRVRVTDEDRTTTRSIVTTDDKTDSKVEKRTKTVVYVSETLAVKAGDKKPTKLKRTYEKAEESKDGEVTKLPLDGKAVIVEKKGDKYTFSYADDGKAVDGKAREELDKEFNKTDKDDIDDFIPRKPLKAGDTWKLDTDKLIKLLAKDTFAVDAKTATGTGKLVEGYTFGGKQFGVYDLRVEFPVTELKGDAPIALKKGSKMALQIIADGNADGTEPDGFVTTRLTLRAYFDGPNGVGINIKSDGVVTRAVERLPSRKSD
jgi:hypothetical protein